MTTAFTSVQSSRTSRPFSRLHPDVFGAIDCISHDAVATIKRLCRPYQPLRTASVATLLSALAMTFRSSPTVIAAE